MIHTIHFSLHEVAPYINWLYFFHAWGFPARLGSIARVHGCEACRRNWLMGFPPEERVRAQEAMRLYDDAQQLLSDADARFKTHAIVGLFPAQGEGDDIVILAEDSQEPFRIPFLRQQQPDADGICLCMSDFVRPKEKGKDLIGVFACSVDKGLEDGEADHEYRHLLHQTIADRLAEATAEKMHEMVRKHLWAFSPQECLTIDQLHAEHYQGKRPAVGYPSIPDQSIAFLIDQLLMLSTIRVSLTESGAMRPHASTCGFILSHPATRHFCVGPIGEDQLCNYASRRGMSTEEMRKFLS